MLTTQEKVTVASSLAFRALTYAFLRIIPSHDLPKIIYTLFAIYIPSFIASFLTQSQFEVAEDNIDVTVTETEVEDQPPTNPSTAAHSRNLRRQDKPRHLEQEVAIEETVTIQEKSPKFWRTLLTGLPSPTSAALSLLTLLINVGLILSATDFIYRAKIYHPSHDLSFARVGYVSPTEAKLLVREPNDSQFPIFVSYRDDAEAPWKSSGSLLELTNDTDYTGVVTIGGLVPDKTYQWAASNNNTGYFKTPPMPGQISKDGTFTFLTTSCIKPRFPYNPSQHALSIPGFNHMAKVIRSIPGGAQFMLFLGDFIYIDNPKRFGTSSEDYRREYRQVYASPDWPAVGQNLSWIHVLDDHEIQNDWDGKDTGVYEVAADSWHHYHTSVNPPQARQAGSLYAVRRTATYFEFTQGPASFFMMDTRKYRDKNNLPANSTEKKMLGAEQLADFLAYLARPEPKGVKWKIVASSIPFTKNWRVNSIDTWAGFLHERQIILEAMWDVGLRGGVGVVIVSGDRHEFAATAFPPPAGGRWPISATVNEFSTSPLSQFYLPTPTYFQNDEEDIMVKYIPNGNSKLGAITIENPPASEQSILKFRLYVDGVETWSSVLLSPPSITGKRWGKDALWG
ncbi:alkaline phosphatase family protein-like protein [Coleophoma cylindrospora]|uniref:Alkaline phosphatase family protein-like protein n=1 Tax=Coleophoma cylindrospora TaxID=1849047 RepID=A0A3D8SPR6_9HELO|nr:alkaline phosphatase family protein-like protein [Coleophoma cylindrospora]